MAPWDVTYSGLRAQQPDYGHGGPIVVGVCRDGERRNLELDDDRVVDGEFEWGYEGSGPRRLALAILNDFLRRKVDLTLSNTFLRDVVAHLPGEFELSGAEIAEWLSARGASASGMPARAGRVSLTAWTCGQLSRVAARCASTRTKRFPTTLS